VFVVDDHRILVDTLVPALDAQEGVEVVGQAGDVATALAKLRGSPADVVLLDLRLEGQETVPDIASFAALPHPPAVVVLTGNGDRRSAARALEAGAAGYLVKDEPLDVVVQSVRAAARGETPISPTMLSGVLRELAGTGGGPLTSRELGVLRLLAEGKGVQEIADELIISFNTTRNHIQRILGKLGARSRLEAVVKARADGLID